MQTVWTDGACKGNPGPGGWAWATVEGRWASGAEARSTNQRMEIKAAYEAVKAFDGPVTVRSDSTYVVNCFRDRWWERWLRREWRNAQNKPVANRDLWEPFVALYRSRPDVRFEWVKGHAGDPMNDLVDRLAVAAAERQTGGSGDTLPADPGAPDSVAGVAGDGTTTATAAEPVAPSSSPPGKLGRDARLPAGRLVGVFGLRPPDLGGYDDNPVAAGVRRRLGEVLEAKAQLHPDLVVVTGLRLGAEQLGAEAARSAGLPYVVVLPFPGADAKWPESARAHFRRLLDGAAAEILLERKVPDTSAKVAGSLRRRDAWLARNLDEAVVVWDGHEPFVGRLRSTLEDHLGDDVWELAPA